MPDTPSALIPPKSTIEEIQAALRWAQDGGEFDHIRKDVPKAAQPWVRDRLMQVSQRFRVWARESKIWLRMDGRGGLSDLDPPLQDWIREHVMPVLGQLKGFYEGGLDAGTQRRMSGRALSKEECQSAYDFIVSGQMPERMCDMPKELQWDLDCALEVPTRHLEKEADAASHIAAGMYAMGRTQKNVDAPCKEAVAEGLADLIAALETRLRELGRGR